MSSSCSEGNEEEGQKPTGDGKSGRSVGIDLGTTNSAVAAVIDGKLQIIENKAGKRTTPSAVGFVKK